MPFSCGLAPLELMLTTVPVSVIKKLPPLARGVSALIEIPEKYHLYWVFMEKIFSSFVARIAVLLWIVTEITTVDETLG